jgi:tRNA A-37 threonylcarbamoyl transferase component Bud32
VSDSEARTGAQPCPQCSKPLEEGIRFCPHCGTPLTETSATRMDSTPTGGKRPQSQELALPTVIGNRYRLEEFRGGGGMAKVYKAVDTTLERVVAVKLINADLRNETEFDARFQREAKIASQLADPHIVVVHDFGLDPAHGPYLVMEYLEGQSLRERLTTGGPLPLKAGLQLAGQLLLALIHAHNKNIVHRDIKPDNIFVLNQSGVRLLTRVLDFGIARIYKRDDPSHVETLTHHGAVLGTPRYMSPEQLAGQPVDARSDLYSAALVIFEALTGQIPYPGGKRLCELCPEASPGLQDLLEQCLKPNAAERPPTAIEVYLRLQELGKASGILLLPPGAMDRLVAARKASDPTEVYKPTRDGKLRRRVLIALAVVVVLLGLLAACRWMFGLFKAASAGPESLHGIKIGDAREDVQEKLKLPTVSYGNPFDPPKVRPHLGVVVQPFDLNLSGDGELRRLETRSTEGSRPTVVIFYNGKVVAVVSHDRAAATSRGVKVGDSISRVYDYYPEGGESKEAKLSDGTHVEVRRYDELGVGFEIRKSHVTAVTIYPPK